MEREALELIYLVNKFRHYLLGNKFSFHVDHQALMYLVNKPNIIGEASQMDNVVVGNHNFTVVHFLGKEHFPIQTGEHFPIHTGQQRANKVRSVYGIIV